MGGLIGYGSGIGGLSGWVDGWVGVCGAREDGLTLHACMHVQTGRHASISGLCLCCAVPPSVRAYLGVGRGGVGDERHGLLLVVAEGLDHLLLGINMYVVVCCGD